MAENTSKFIFTREGSRLLVSQTGGIKFAILGYMLIEGLAGDADPSALCAGGLEARWKQIEEEADNAKMSTIEYLTTQKTNMTFIMKNVPYIYAGTDGSPNGYVAPANIDEYREALANYKKNLYGTFYIPSTETQDTNGNHYGSYAFNFDRTNLNCKIDKENGINIRHILVIGKQYAENKDATFNVNERQDASIVGVAEIVNTDGYGIQILPGQNDFVTFQCQLRFTVCPHINEDLMAETEIFIGDNGDYTEVYEEVSDIASKLALVNNGLKTLSGGITIGQNKEILDELQLGPDGAICMTKTLMVADCVDASDAENQFNAAALIHPINKYPTDGGEYVPQVLMTTVHPTSNYNEDIVAYSVGMTVKAEGVGDPFTINGGTISAPAAPVFKLGHVPENDRISVDIFGLDNITNGYVQDRFLFSRDNSATMPAYGDPNVIIDSIHNSFTFGASQNHNSLYRSNHNVMLNGPADNILLASDMNSYSGGNYTVMLAADNNSVVNGSDNIVIASDFNTIKSHHNTFIESDSNSATDNASKFNLYSSDNNLIEGNAYDNVLLDSDNNTLSGTTTNTLLIKSTRVKSKEDTKGVVGLGIKDTLLNGAYEDSLINSRGSTMKKSYFNGFIDNVYCMAVSSEQNTMSRSRFVGIKGLPLGSIDSAERPILSDVQSNNNIIMGGEYFDLFSSSNNIIMDSYKLQSNDSAASLGPVRIKGSSIICSSKSKLYNAREVHLLNSEYTRVNAVSNYNDASLNLMGTSRDMASTAELDSIYYGEFYNPYYGDEYAYYGLKGASYKVGAESLKTTSRPADMLKLKMMFINSFGSELNLAGFNPGYRRRYYTAYDYNASFADQNKTLMIPSVKPTNTNVIGGHHNKVIGGKNSIILGGEYCKASTYGHQVLMGKFNKDVPADMIYGCGHFNGDSYTQGNKQYLESDLENLETMANTIDNVRGDTGDINGETCYNAMEFYAHQGKLILQNCDDGHDAGTNVWSNDFGKTITVSPDGIIFRDREGEITGQVLSTANKSEQEWTFFINFDWPEGVHDTTGGTPYVADTIGVPTYLTQMDKYKLASTLCLVVDTANWCKTGTATTIMTSNDVYDANNTLFKKGENIPVKINVIFLDWPTNKETGAQVAPKDWECINKIYPWLTTEGQAPRYLTANKCDICYTVLDMFNEKSSDGYARFGLYWRPSLENKKCKSMDVTDYSWYMDNRCHTRLTKNCIGSVVLSEKNSNTVFSDWYMSLNSDNY